MQNVIEQSKEMTKRQVNFLIVLFFSVFPLLHFALNRFALSSDVLFYEQINIILNSILAILLYMSYLSYILWFMTILRWSIRNRVYRGIKYAFKHYFMVLKIRKMFLDSNYFVNRVYFGRTISEPLKIKLEITDDNIAILHIKNHLKFDTKLDGARISSALGDYIVETDYISKDNNYYIYELINAKKMNLQSEYKTFQEYKEWCVSDVTAYQLKVDDKLTLDFGHFLIVGRTGSGKTYALYHLLLQAYIKPTDKRAEFYYCDPKGSSLMIVGRLLSARTTALPDEETGSNFTAMKNKIEEVYNLLTERQKALESKLGKEKLDADYSDFGMSPIVLIIDEYGAFSNMLSSETKKQEPRDISGMITSIIFMGRQLGIFVWIVMQQANAKALPTSIRDNMMFRTVLGNAERTTYDTAFDVSETADVPNIKKSAGIGVYRYDKSEKNKLSLLAFPYLNFDILNEFERIGKRINNRK